VAPTDIFSFALRFNIVVVTHWISKIRCSQLFVSERLWIMIVCNLFRCYKLWRIFAVIVGLYKQWNNNLKRRVMIGCSNTSSVTSSVSLPNVRLAAPKWPFSLLRARLLALEWVSCFSFCTCAVAVWVSGRSQLFVCVCQCTRCCRCVTVLEAFLKLYVSLKNICVLRVKWKTLIRSENNSSLFVTKRELGSKWRFSVDTCVRVLWHI